MAAVCGFEAYINGKHIIGVVKERQQAQREYKQAIEQGHGAYLMNEGNNKSVDIADLFLQRSLISSPLTWEIFLQIQRFSSRSLTVI